MGTTKIISELKKDEGLRLKAYQDHLGVWTIGYGTNLQKLEIDEAQAEKWLLDYVDGIRARAEKLPLYIKLTPTRQDVILSMMYQMGYNGVMNFRHMWRAILDDDYAEAADEMRDSKWWRDPQTRGRAERMAKRMDTGNWDV